ncbi:hypothetical protein evm_013846 [Chilo suppressalis]|nr:hypothetical protein evm_013846 [Chilo suppressalis]
MRGAALTVILFSCAATVACANDTNDLVASNVMDVGGEESEHGGDQDGEKKPASFLIVIEHESGWRCSGSLVSLRTALTSAWCARGRRRSPARDLWALAAAAAASDLPAARLDGARRIVRVAVATGADAEVGEAPEWDGSSWRGGALDLALAELERAFGVAARAVPILMATGAGAGAGECAPPAACHVARAITPSRPPRRARLDIVGADLQPPDTCAAAAKHWTSVKEHALCLVGSELCESDWGAGVVCGGKVCGVLSRSVRGAGESEEGAGRSCGDTHVAQSIARWRRFLHCAHTLRACGSDGDCAELCVERRLVDDPSPASVETIPTSRRPPSAASSRPRGLARATRTRLGSGGRRAQHTHTHSATRSSPPPSAPPQPDDAPASASVSSLAQEFEPNRADFKAGEYGDNVAEYGGGNDELPAPTPTPTPTRTPSPANETTPPAQSPPSLQPPPPGQLQPQPERRTAADAGTPIMPQSSTAQTATITITMYCFVKSIHLMRDIQMPKKLSAPKTAAVVVIVTPDAEGKGATYGTVIAKAKKEINIAAEPYSVPPNSKWAGDVDGSVAIMAKLQEEYSAHLCVVERGLGYVAVTMGELAMIGVYFSPNRGVAQLQAWLDVLGGAVRRMAPRQVVVLGDFNAKHPAWGSPRATPREESVWEWSVTSELILQNRGTHHTCVRMNGGSIVDLTFASPAVAARIQGCRVLPETETLSDHLYICIRVSPPPDLEIRQNSEEHFRRWVVARFDMEAAEETILAQEQNAS